MTNYDIPLLGTRDIDVRTQSVSKSRNGEVGATLLLYKDARVDMRILDSVFGLGNWQRHHEVINGNLFCTIEIWDEDKKCWIKKQDVGVPSNAEAEKGQASDAFKRAGTNVGIGRELYTGPFIYVTLSEKEYYSSGKDRNGKDVYRMSAGVKFRVSEIGYNDRREINKLVIVDRFGNVRYQFGGSGERGAAPKSTNTAKPTPCSKCGKPITDAKKTDGSTWYASDIATYTAGRFGSPLCAHCGAEAGKAAKAGENG